MTLRKVTIDSSVNSIAQSKQAQSISRHTHTQRERDREIISQT